MHYALDLWFEKKVKPRMHGRAMLIRYADDFVCAFQYANDAERFYKVLPKRLKRFNLEVAEDKTSLLRFSRFHPSETTMTPILKFVFFIFCTNFELVQNIIWVSHGNCKKASSKFG
ncbi:hypothetical protein [Pseudoalteromonas sp. NEC-BIFX-2020_002]|uniref:hypothetical protein n=1 Tax=Pseudoalteromonas sp. NEC-BIFX-2020_002 TaxID=2732353 RepID=UPI0024B62F6D|nr:hypothetical protein [Pseudoalteromonas sp. NEC-BIFX-2020_002]